MTGNDLPLDRLLERGPLKHRRLENRSRCIRVIFQQFGRTASVITEVEPAVETALVVVPALGDQWPECFRYLQSAQIILIVAGVADEFAAHAADLTVRPLTLPLDLPHPHPS